MPVKALREYSDMGLVYTIGRSPGNYRLFDESALWCVKVIRGLRSLGLSVAEVASVYLARTDQPIGPHLAERLSAARAASTLASASSRSFAFAWISSRQLIRRSWQEKLAPTSGPATKGRASRLTLPPAGDCSVEPRTDDAGDRCQRIIARPAPPDR
ncbi:MerR family transcriptional regulator [Candidatus Nephthysia bennettiae]|uniref:MerR family transcriptional regulator n=1 Tax=Candidatus Nephthysia bennettiae TaxID=3127016 RepID=UPI0033130314